MTQVPSIIDLRRWESELPELAKKYQAAAPFPHIVLDGFIERSAADECSRVFPRVEDKGWIHYIHVNERKHGLNKIGRLPEQLQEVILELNSDRFVSWLEKLTGINGLKADAMLEGGGLHQSGRGGYLNIHADFTVHPHKRTWRRRINVLLYLEKDWAEEWGGALELWQSDMSKCVERIVPLFDRCVIFNTDADSYHGFPDPITCPEHISRKSIALYYYTDEEKVLPIRSTNYRARPSDGLHALPIWLDKQAIAIYTRLKSLLGINDDLISRLLNRSDRKKK
jgi:hypothetical protein